MHGSIDFVEKNLSIVLQGPLSISNILEIVNNCQHWRYLFPESEIILSVSTNEAIDRIDSNINSSSRYCLKHYHMPNVIAENSISIVDQCCDHIVLAKPAIPLPSIKATDGPNNSSFMINAAQAGLAAASKNMFFAPEVILFF